jgi:hypothetical protein
MPEAKVLADILERAGAGPGHFYLLWGQGRLLAALPAESPAFLRTLAFYRPQRLTSRTWVFLLKLLRSFHAQGVALRKWSWPGASHASIPCPGVLLGNPVHSVPRAIFLLQEGQAWRVGKFVPDPHQQQILQREKELLDLAAHQGGHAPRCLGWKPCGSGGALWTEWLAAQEGNPSTTDRLRILHDWLLPKPLRPLSEFPAWKSSSGWPEASAAEVQAASRIQLRPCLRHGDFAPWNLLQGADGTWVAVDWEEGCAEDAPGLDLIHDLLQKEFLIRRSPLAEAKAKIFAALQEPPCAEYLTACGWSGHERILLGWALDFEARSRTEIKLWIQSR